MPRIFPLDVSTYEPHRIHGEGRDWAETNCYADVVIELLHGMGFEPIAALPFTLSVDFDVDQWTFFKFRHADIEALYGLGIHELAPWRPLAEHVEEQVGAGRPVLVELDSFYLPDTAGTSYRLTHVKSTVAVNEIDCAGRRMGYFHNQGYHALDGQDFVDVFQAEGLVHERMLPPYIEFVKVLPQQAPLRGDALVQCSLASMAGHLRQLPAENPFVAFKERFLADLEWLQGSSMEVFHGYSFATVRQCGSCFELAATYLGWLAEQGVDVPEGPLQAFTRISQTNKMLQFKLARSVRRGKPMDTGPLDDLAEDWETAMAQLVRSFG